jgi:hypothetical protein
MKKLSFPGTGWNTESVITGCIKIRLHSLVEESMKIINDFDFDEVFPFTNIFWGASPAAYGFPLISFAGSYKQIEEAWNEWMWKLGQLLSCLDAVEAHVNLNCILGDFHWTLQPKLHFEHPTIFYTSSMRHQIWGITDAPELDFSIDPLWQSHCAKRAFGGWNDWEQLERWVKAESPET